MNICILAAGAWGTALATAFSRQHHVTLWSHNHNLAEDIARHGENKRYLPGYLLSERIRVTHDLGLALRDTQLILVATPVNGLRMTATKIQELLKIEAVPKSVPILWACKGFEADSGCLPHQIVTAVCPDQTHYGVLSGPSFAEEVAQGSPTALSLAMSTDSWRQSQDLVQALHSDTLRIYANRDLIGVEVGGALKNVLAIATGVCDGLQLGHNARAALVTRGLAEIARLGVALGAQPGTFMGLSGIGDLLLTCTGDLSRNRKVGLLLATGQKLESILAELGHVAEGVYTAHEALRLAGIHKVDMPITKAVTDVLNAKLSPEAALQSLMMRGAKEESLSLG